MPPLLLCALSAAAQTAPPAPSAPPSSDRAQVLFSRSASSAAQDTAQAPAETAPPALAASLTDAMRLAPAFTRYDFTIHLQPAAHLQPSAAAIEVELRAQIRNTGSAPLPTLPLQLSSTLHFEHIRLGGSALRFAVHPLQSDADHTGALTEAAVELPSPLAPGGTLNLIIDYSGAIPQSSERLDRIGTPAIVAQRSDWDQISPGFTGLRGFGDTVWYPVASVPALLGQGDSLFQEIGRQKQQNSAATVAMHVTEEFTGDAPDVAVLDGQQCAIGAPLSLPTAAFPGIVQATLPATPLGFGVPSLILAARVRADSGPQVSVAALPAHAPAASAYLAAGQLLDPLFHDWFGGEPQKPLLLVDLPVDGADASEDGDALLLSLTGDPAPALADALAGPLTHAYFRSPRAWLDQGVPGLMSVLWTERTAGADKAMEQLSGNHAALALAEPGTPGESAGEPLLTARDAVYFRTKATYVLWMLRSLVGDGALSAALRAYDPAQDTTPGYFEKLLEHALASQGITPPGELPVTTQAVPGANDEDLHWFFRNWVYEDPGLPDLAIRGVFSNRTGAGDQWLVSVNIANTGYAEAEVPVTVHSGATQVTVAVRVPARGSIARRILIQGEPTEVDVNDGGVPEVEDSVHKRLIQ